MLNTINLDNTSRLNNLQEQKENNQLLIDKITNFIKNQNKITVYEENFNVIACFFQLNSIPKIRLIRL